MTGPIEDRPAGQTTADAAHDIGNMSAEYLGRAESLSDEAITWLARLQSGQARAGDHASFALWRARSPAHEAAARAAETLWRDLGATSSAQAFAAVRRRDPARLVLPPIVTSDGAPRFSRRRILGGALTASALAVAGGTAVTAPLWAPPLAALGADLATGTGERRLARLPDGSMIHLNSATAVSVDFSAGLRRLVLHDGEILVAATADRDRPFTVEAAGGRTRLTANTDADTNIGTGPDASSADIRHDEDQVTVVSLTGPVDVAAGDASLHLAAGESIGYAAAGFLAPPAAADVAALTAWQRGKLIFNHRPLIEVCGELHRYGLPRFYLASRRLERLPVTGVFDLADPEGTLEVLQRSLGIEILRLPFLILLREADHA